MVAVPSVLQTWHGVLLGAAADPHRPIPDLSGLAVPAFAAKARAGIRRLRTRYRIQPAPDPKARFVTSAVETHGTAASAETCFYDDSWVVDASSDRVISNQPVTERSTWRLSRQSDGTWKIAATSTTARTPGADQCPPS